ncbi:sterol desaturase family protein [Perlucidibaca piscinae]|uniref:sterol desaturase family protein n=1 Tax=Perlucidibaca piscinae TaxID=392589 RepID=UPI0003B52F62|nr:sterol desaturase family protein [Perlucidibaca piscinae]
MMMAPISNDDAWTPSRLVAGLLLVATLLTLFVEFPDADNRSWASMLGSHLQSAWRWILPVMLVAGILQFLFPATVRKPKFLFYENAVDLIHILFNSLFYLTFFGIAASATRRFLVDHTPWLIFDWAADLPLFAQALLMLLLLDFLVYWRHRFEHRISLLWPIHLIHHTSRRIDVLTTHRLHFLEVMLGGIIVGWATSVSGLSRDAISIALLVYIHYNHFIHSNIDVRFSSPLRFILVSPFMHRWHHALDKEGHDKNFGVVFAWNDWVFGTAFHPSHEPACFGLELDQAHEVNESWLRQQIYPFRIWVQKLAALTHIRRQVS